MDVTGKVCVERIKKSRFGMEFFEEPEKLDRVRENYKELKDYFPNTFIIKGDSRRPDEINQEIIEIIKNTHS